MTTMGRSTGKELGWWSITMEKNTACSNNNDHRQKKKIKWNFVFACFWSILFLLNNCYIFVAYIDLKVKKLDFMNFILANLSSFDHCKTAMPELGCKGQVVTMLRGLVSKVAVMLPRPRLGCGELRRPWWPSDIKRTASRSTRNTPRQIENRTEKCLSRRKPSAFTWLARLTSWTPRPNFQPAASGLPTPKRKSDDVFPSQFLNWRAPTREWSVGVFTPSSVDTHWNRGMLVVAAHIPSWFPVEVVVRSQKN